MSIFNIFFLILIKLDQEFPNIFNDAFNILLVLKNLLCFFDIFKMMKFSWNKMLKKDLLGSLLKGFIEEIISYCSYDFLVPLFQWTIPHTTLVSLIISMGWRILIIIFTMENAKIIMGFVLITIRWRVALSLSLAIRSFKFHSRLLTRSSIIRLVIES